LRLNRRSSAFIGGQYIFLYASEGCPLDKKTNWPLINTDVGPHDCQRGLAAI
jgi:hypothetical protein